MEICKDGIGSRGVGGVGDGGFAGGGWGKCEPIPNQERGAAERRRAGEVTARFPPMFEGASRAEREKEG